MDVVEDADATIDPVKGIDLDGRAITLLSLPRGL
jgi:hypothetical protein